MEKTDLPAATLTQTPQISDSAFIAKTASVTGDVRLGEGVSVWYSAVLRGDINRIVIGDRSNLQDGVVVHVENFLPCIVGADVTIGHNATLHGCTIGDGTLVGIGAIVLSGVSVGRGSVIGAGALVLEGTKIGDGELWVGAPARKIRDLGDEAYRTNLKWSAKYVALAEKTRQLGV